AALVAGTAADRADTPVPDAGGAPAAGADVPDAAVVARARRRTGASRRARAACRPPTAVAADRARTAVVPGAGDSGTRGRATLQRAARRCAAPRCAARRCAARQPGAAAGGTPAATGCTVGGRALCTRRGPGIRPATGAL